MCEHARDGHYSPSESLFGTDIRYTSAILVNTSNRTVSRNHYIKAGMVCSGFEHSTIFCQNYQRNSSTTIQSRDHLLNTDYLWTMMSTNYGSHAQT